MKKERFTALLHHVNVDLLRASFFDLKKDAAPGVDGQTWEDYAATLQPRLEDLHARVQRGAYRPSPSRRVYIPKPDGRQRPLAVAALEDKIVQRAVATVLNALLTRKISSGSHMGSGPDAVPMMRSMRSWWESSARR
jgi:retron-type reverse transcriptase